MTLVQADGQNVRPVEIDESRIAPGETYDVIVQPEKRAYTVIAEARDRSGFTRDTLAPRAGMNAPVPTRRKRPVSRHVRPGYGHAGHGHGQHEARGCVRWWPRWAKAGRWSAVCPRPGHTRRRQLVSRYGGA